MSNGSALHLIPLAQRWMLLALMPAMALSLGSAIYPQNTWLQVGPVAIALPFAWAALRRWPVSTFAMCGVFGFLLLHLIGATWSYSFVPYDSLLDGLFGSDLAKIFGWQRNMYDRLVHFTFGVLLVQFFAEIGFRYAGASKRMAIGLAVLAILAISSLYEIFEWSLTMTLAPADAGAYNGEQGDPFDSQKDMAWAALGALLAVPLAARHLAAFSKPPAGLDV